MRRGTEQRRSLLFSACLLLGACQALYFDSVDTPATPLRREVGELAREYWTGIVLNGEKVGFTHLRMVPDDPGWRIDSLAVLKFQLLGFSKSVSLEATDELDTDLQLRRFSYRYDLDGSVLAVEGGRESAELRLRITRSGETTEQVLPVDGPLWPTSVIQMKPVLGGLAPDTLLRYQVFDGETQTITEVEQRVGGLERSRLFDGTAWRVETRMHGHEVTSWINADGLPELELSLHGALIAHLEPAERARNYLIEGAMSKREALLDFSLVRVDQPLPDPRQTERLRVVIERLPQGFEPARGSGQRCENRGDGRWFCDIGEDQTDTRDAVASRHLAPSAAVPSRSPTIERLVQTIRGESPRTPAAFAMVDWVHANIAPVAADTFSALDVLSSGQGECQGQSTLLAALLRAADVPARIVNGLVYSEDLDAFAWHTWVEFWDDGHWSAMDPILGQRRADATHLRLLEGETPAELLPLLELVGRVRLSVQ